MAVLQGISGIAIGDGNGGNIALSIIQNKVLRILHDDNFAWRFATYAPTHANAGSVSYYVPELLTTGSYTSAKYGKSGTPQVPQSGLVTVNIDTRRFLKYDLEMFDISRLGEVEYIMSMIATGIALIVQADLNAQFWLRIRNWFADNNRQNQQIEVEYIGNDVPYDDALPNKLYAELVTLNREIVKIGQTFNKKAIGVNKAEMFCIFSPGASADLPLAFRQQPNAIGEWQVDRNLVGKQILNIKYIEDNMLDLDINKEDSFNGDYDVKLKNVLGLIAHNESLAMPINMEALIPTIDPNTGNQRIIVRYQFGWGVLRDWLIRLVVKQGNKITATTPTENQV